MRWSRGAESAALAWYQRLPGCAVLLSHDTEAVWELAEHRSVFIVQQPDHAGHAMQTIIVDDLDTVVAEIAQRGPGESRRPVTG